jgi:hypothetical protein
MEAFERDGVVVAKTKFTPVDAARLALTAPPIPLTPRRTRLLLIAATVWCREMQFPTVRELATALGVRSTSTVVNGFAGHLGVQAAVVAHEWTSLREGWFAPGGVDRAAWLVRHAVDLHRLDPACLRLPGYVCAAVEATGLSGTESPEDLTPPLHVLAAFAGRSRFDLEPVALRRMLLVAADSRRGHAARAVSA